MRLLVIYASDLEPASRIAPGGITTSLRGDLGGLPSDWDVEVWGAGPRDVKDAPRVREVDLGQRSVRLRPLVLTEPPARRRRPLAPAFAAAVLHRGLSGAANRKRWDVIVAHRTEYLAALLPVRMLLPPSVAVIHGSSAFAFAAMGRGMGDLQRLGEAIAVPMASAVALVAESTLPYYRSRYRTHADRIFWIPNGVAPMVVPSDTGPAWRAEVGLLPSDRVLMYHGRYDREKGLRRMLEVMRVLRDDGHPWHLVCAGVGPEESVVAEAVRTWGAGFIHDLGYLNHTGVRRALSGADIGLLLSDFEGLSIGLLEAVSAGLPVVATDVGDNNRVLRGIAPWLTVGKDVTTIVGCVRHAWILRCELRERTAAVAKEFSLARRVERFKHLFECAADDRIADYGTDTL